MSVTYNRSVIWFSQSTPVSFTSKTDHHHIIDILLKVVLNTLTQGGRPLPSLKLEKIWFVGVKKLRRAVRGAKIFGVFRVKNHDFTPKNHIFSYCRRRHKIFWGISCEKSRFYAKKSYFFLLRREAQIFWGYFVSKITIYAKKSYPLHSNYNDWQYGIHAYNVHVHNNNKEILIHMYYSTLEVGWGKEMTKPLRKSRSNITRLQSVASGSFQTYLYPKCW